VPELDDECVHDMRDYYYRHVRWTQGLMLGVLAAGAAATQVIEGRQDLSLPGVVRLSMVAVLVPGIFSRRPAVHAAQALLLVVAMIIAVSFVAAPIG
jgi:FtsH-binding integral membrane protein